MTSSHGAVWRDLADRHGGWVVRAAVIGILTILIASPRVDDSAVVVDFDDSLALLSHDVLEAAPPSQVIPRVAAILTDVLGVAPLPPMLLYTYPTRAALRHGLIRHAGVSPTAAVDLAATSLGLALPRTVFLLAGADHGDRVRLLAHETMHLIQLELSGTDARPAQWLMEGIAEWAAFTVLARVGARDVGERQRSAVAAAARYLIAHPTFTPVTLRRPEDFTRWRRAAGDVVAYQVAYALAQRLVEERGILAVVAYFRGFRDIDASTSFRRAFGTSVASFMVVAGAAIRGARGAATTALPPDTASPT